MNPPKFDLLAGGASAPAAGSTARPSLLAEELRRLASGPPPKRAFSQTEDPQLQDRDPFAKEYEFEGTCSSVSSK